MVVISAKKKTTSTGTEIDPKAPLNQQRIFALPAPKFDGLPEQEQDQNDLRDPEQSRSRFEAGIKAKTH